MKDFELLLLSGAITLAGIVLILFSPVRIKSSVAFCLLLANAVLTSIPALHALSGQPLSTLIYGSSFFGNIPIRIDALSAWFILIINLTCVNGAFYGIGYMKQAHLQTPSQREGEHAISEGRGANLSLHWSMFLLFHSSMLWVCMFQHGLAFLVTWEIMSLSSLILVIFEYQNHSVLKAGMNYLVQMHIGVVFLTVAFIWVYYSEGSYDFNAISKFFRSNTNAWLFLLFFVGFGIKAGFIPLHSWLPYAHPAAPSHVSGVMSGVIVKMGIYGILRVALMLQHDLMLIGESLLILSIATGLYGILNAAVYRDFKRMLAYCTIENIGIIGAGIGLALMGSAMHEPVLFVIGLSAALLHTLNHSLFKSLLFFSAGSVYQQTHTRDMEKLGGLIQRMPQTGGLFLIGSLAIGGLPPFNGFVSEFLLYTGFLSGIKSMSMLHSTLLLLSLGGLAIIGGLSILTFTKNFGTIFLGSPRTKLHTEPVESSLVMRIPQYIIVAAMFSIGLFPQFYFSALQNITGTFNPPVFQSLVNLMSVIGKYALLFLLLTASVLFVRMSLTRNRSAEFKLTWGCGYILPNSKLQYTGKSFSKSLGKLLAFIVTEKKKYIELRSEEIFPETRKYSSHYTDFFENTIFDGIVNRLLHGIGYFGFVQNGRIQMYVLYGVFFILLIFIGTLLGMI